MSSETTGPKRSEEISREHSLALAVDLLGKLLRATPDEIDATIQHALEQLGQFCGIDRSYVFRIKPDENGEVIDNTHEWCAEHIAESRHLNRDLPVDLMESVQERLSRNEVIEVSDVDGLPEGSALKAHLQLQGVRSLLMVPLRAGDTLSGFVGFDAVAQRRVFARSEVQLLGSIADAIGAALARADATAEIAAARNLMAEAHDRLKTTLGALSELVVEVDSAGRYVGVFTADTEQMMVPREQLLGKTHEEVMPPDIAALNRRAMAEVDATGRSGPHMFWAETPRGRRRYAVTVSSRPPDRPGKEPGYVFVARDTTEEWRLAAEAERLGLIARRMTDLVIIVGTDDCVEWVNPAFEARTGWGLDEVRGRRPSEFLRAPEADQVQTSQITAGMKAGRAVRAELLNRTRDGAHFWTDIDLQPLRDADGLLTGYVFIETDITQRKQQAEMLENLAREATEARARLEMAVEALPDAFVYFDADDRMVLCNTRYRSMFPKAEPLIKPGVSYETVLRAIAASGELPEAIGREDAWIAERVRNHHLASGTLDRQLAGKWIRTIERRTPDGGRVGMRIDITEVKEAERRLADIIDGAEAGTWEWNVPLGTNLVNARWAEIVGYTLEELGPLTIDVWRRLVHSEDLVAAEAKVARVLSREIDHFEYELRMRHKAGHWVWVSSRGRVARWSSDGEPEVMAGVHIDITALKRAEERLGEIIDAAAAGTWELDLVSDTKRVNERWAEMLGYTRAELADRRHFGFHDLVHPDDLDMMTTQHETCLTDGGDRFANEIRMRHKAGHWVWVLSRGRVTARDSNGRPSKLAGIHLDITERMRLEAQLTAERDYLASLMDASVSGIVALDEAGRIIFANRGAERILGLSASEIDGLRYDDSTWNVLTLDGKPFAAEALPFRRVMTENRIIRDVRFSIAWPDGSRRMLLVNAAPINAQGLGVRVVASISDITDQVAAENELRHAAERAEAANRAKSLFLANMSHEIRTPLNGVLGMAQMLEGELSDPRHLEMLMTIRTSGETLLGVLNDVLDMSKIEAGKLTLELAPFVPASLAYQVESIHRVQAVEKRLALELSVDAAAEQRRLGDPGRLAQILHNLVGNAVKFTESGRVDVTMGADADGALLLVVRDTGIGMTPEQVSRVFEEFEQADGTVTRRFGGTGLGMSIVKRLVELMEGEIAVESAPGQGTEVRLRLPLPLAGAMPDEVAAQSNASVAGLRILAADDNRTNRMILDTLMTKLGAEIILAEDGRAAVEAWEPDRFDLYLLDISMPELDGIAALSELRACEARAAHRSLPAIALTANVMSHQVDEYLRAGFKGYVGKPFRGNDLVAAIVNAINS
ncbi:PAS domain S-box protein [Natronohydrobacter thiooxidans]|uniref:PAS domain S-box protein n=1 Tax=Natronohydrobacter thiooxidans TaxID=87172 RepID=UPI0008FF1614|nr:PAS domain S-box protein [Natronohydrobacter thiooxidans]